MQLRMIVILVIGSFHIGGIVGLVLGSLLAAVILLTCLIIIMKCRGNFSKQIFNSRGKIPTTSQCMLAYLMCKMLQFCFVMIIEA